MGRVRTLLIDGSGDGRAMALGGIVSPPQQHLSWSALTFPAQVPVHPLLGGLEEMQKRAKRSRKFRVQGECKQTELGEWFETG